MLITHQIHKTVVKKSQEFVVKCKLHETEFQDLTWTSLLRPFCCNRWHVVGPSGELLMTRDLFSRRVSSEEFKSSLKTWWEDSENLLWDGENFCFVSEIFWQFMKSVSFLPLQTPINTSRTLITSSLSSARPVLSLWLLAALLSLAHSSAGSYINLSSSSSPSR